VCTLLHLSGLQLTLMLRDVEFLKVGACAALGEAAGCKTRMDTLFTRTAVAWSSYCVPSSNAVLVLPPHFCQCFDRRTEGKAGW
jgi:hypothetical protein